MNANAQSVKLEVLDFKPTYILVKMASSGQEVKLSKRFFKKRVESGMFEVINQNAMPSVI